MINQFETSPLNTKESLVKYCEKHNVKVMIYSPLKSTGRTDITEYQSYLKGLGEKYEKSPAQIILRFDTIRGMIPIPKSTNASRLQSNINIFDFMLTEEEMNKLFSFNMDLAYMPESRSCPGL